MIDKAKQLDDAYPFDNPIGIHQFLKHREKLEASCYLHGGVAVVDMLIDFERLEQDTPLTTKQRDILDLRYGWGYSQVEIGEILGIAHQTVGEHLVAALKKLASHYARCVA